MDKRKVYYLLHNGKNSNIKYYLRSYLREYTPKIFSRMQLEHLLGQIEKRPDRDYIYQRADYYCRLTADSPIDRTQWQSEAVRLKNQPMTGQSSYYHDAMEIARFLMVILIGFLYQETPSISLLYLPSSRVVRW